MTKPSISVVVPTHSRPERLAKCLEALARQDLPPKRLEVIVVDDGGDVPLDEVIAPLREAIDVVLLTQANAGPATARNRGVELARAPRLAFTDDDCMPEPGWLSALIERAERSPGAMIGGRTVNTLTDNLLSAASQDLVSYIYARYNSGPDGVKFLTSNNMSVPAATFREVGGFDISYRRAAAEDREFCDRWLRLGLPMAYEPRAVVRHAHALDFRAYWRQHFNYGHSASKFLRERAGAEGRRGHFEAGRFYIDLLRYPFTEEQPHRAAAIASLLALSQVATAAGFFAERLWGPGRGIERARG